VTAGVATSWILTVLLVLNGGFNSLWEECDYAPLLDAIEGIQYYTFLPAMSV